MFGSIKTKLFRVLLKLFFPLAGKDDFFEIFKYFYNKGAFDIYEEKILHGVFELGQTTVADVMTPRCNIDLLHHEDNWEKVFEEIAKTNHSRYPVIKSDRDMVAGLLISKDLLISRRREIEKRRLTDLLREPEFVPESNRLSSVLQTFISTNNHMTLVVDEFGSFVGLVTLEDVLEELVGEIEDEHDEKDERYIHKSDGNSYFVNPIISLVDLTNQLKIEIPSNGADTLGGHIVRHFGRMPRRGDTIAMDNYKIFVNKVSTRRVLEAKIIFTKGE